VNRGVGWQLIALQAGQKFAQAKRHRQLESRGPPGAKTMGQELSINNGMLHLSGSAW
jgi:hypothetical protein